MEHSGLIFPPITHIKTLNYVFFACMQVTVLLRLDQSWVTTPDLTNNTLSYSEQLKIDIIFSMRSYATATHVKLTSYAYRMDKQLTMEKPKRPLSSFNLFYRYKRFLVTGQGAISEEAVKRILFCPAGLEDDLLNPSKSSPSQRRLSAKTNELRRTKIRTALEGKILPSSDKKKRRHRKAENGPSISFVEMGRLMTESWKNVDPFARQVFDDLAGEGRQHYKDALDEYTRMEGLAGGADEVPSWSRRDKPQTAQVKITSTKKVSVNKVSQSVKKESFRSTMTTRSQGSRGASQASSNGGLSNEELPRTYDTTSHAGLNPEYTSRAFPTSGFAPAPAPTHASSGTLSTGESHQFPPASFQVENHQLLPQSHHQPRQLTHQQHYHRYLQYQQQQQQQQEGLNSDANFHQMHHDAYSASIDVLSHLASPRRVISTSAASGGGRDDGQQARVDHHDDYAGNPSDLNLRNEDIKTFFDTVERWR